MVCKRSMLRGVVQSVLVRFKDLAAGVVVLQVGVRDSGIQYLGFGLESWGPQVQELLLERPPYASMQPDPVSGATPSSQASPAPSNSA